MSNATFTFGRFNPPTEEGHGKLVSAVQSHADESGGKHYIFPSRTQDKKKNPMTHEDKVGAMRKLFPKANIVSHKDVHTAIDAVKHLESKGHTHVTMVVGSDRVDEFHKLLNKYRTKEFPKVKKVKVVSAGNRDPDAEGAEGMSASKLRGLVSSGKKKEFVSHYSDPKLGAHIHDKVKAGMQMESATPIGIFLLGGPGSGKDYVLKNIFSRFDLTEVQADQLVNGAAAELYEGKKNIVINGAVDQEKITIIQSILEGYEFDYVHVAVTNKVSRIRNEQRDQPLVENKRIEKFLKAEKLAEGYDCFRFNNSINLNESTEMEQVLFGGQIEKLLERVVNLGLEIKSESEPKMFMAIKEQQVFNGGKPMTGDQIQKAKKAAERRNFIDRRIRDRALHHQNSHIRSASHGSMSEEVWDEPNPKKESKPLSAAQKAKAKARAARAGRKYPNLVDNMWAANEEVQKVDEVSHATLGSYIEKAKKSSDELTAQGKYRQANDRTLNVIKAQTKQIGKRIADIKKSLGEEVEQDINVLFEMQLDGTDEYREHAISTTPGQKIEEPLADKEPCVCGGNGECQCEVTPSPVRSFKDLRKEAIDSTVDIKPELSKSAVKKKKLVAPPRGLDSTMQGLPFASRFTVESKEPTLEEAVQYHLDNNISITENVFRPGSEMFFKMISEAKRLYKEGKYTPADEYEKQMLESDIGEKVMFEGKEVILDFPFEEEQIEEGRAWTHEDEYIRHMDAHGDAMLKNNYSKAEMHAKKAEDAAAKHFKTTGEKIKDPRYTGKSPHIVNEEGDPTGGHGIGKPFRSGGGGAVYVRTGDGGVRKVNFSQSGMKKRYNEPGRVRSFVARHHCLTNKDKTSASYWACRWPRYFSNTGQQWW